MQILPVTFEASKRLKKRLAKHKNRPDVFGLPKRKKPVDSNFEHIENE